VRKQRLVFSVIGVPQWVAHTKLDMQGAINVNLVLDFGSVINGELLFTHDTMTFEYLGVFSLLLST
jgi:hypothetical protein